MYWLTNALEKQNQNKVICMALRVAQAKNLGFKERGLWNLFGVGISFSSAPAESWPPAFIYGIYMPIVALPYYFSNEIIA